MGLLILDKDSNPALNIFEYKKFKLNLGYNPTYPKLEVMNWLEA